MPLTLAVKTVSSVSVILAMKRPTAYVSNTGYRPLIRVPWMGATWCGSSGGPLEEVAWAVSWAGRMGGPLCGSSYGLFQVSHVRYHPVGDPPLHCAPRELHWRGPIGGSPEGVCW